MQITPWGIYLENKDISFEGNITQDGSYKIPNITAYGTYDVTVIPLMAVMTGQKLVLLQSTVKQRNRIL